MKKYVVISGSNKILEMEGQYIKDENGNSLFKSAMDEAGSIQNLNYYPMFDTEDSARAYLINMKIGNLNDLKKDIEANLKKLDVVINELKEASSPNILYYKK
jgi:hypothetical protein